MSIDKVREYFRAFGIEDRILEFDVSSATVELAARASPVNRPISPSPCPLKSMNGPS